MTSTGIHTRWLCFVLASGALLISAGPTLGQGISAPSIVKNVGNDADSSSNPTGDTSIRFERKTAVAVQGTTASTLSTRYSEGIGVDTGTQSQSLSQASSYTVQFTVTSPSTYFITVETRRAGDLNLKDDGSGGATASVGAVTGMQTGGTLTSGSLSISTPLTASIASGVNVQFDTFQTARIDGVSNGSPVVHTLTFTWNASCASTGDECGVRMGIPINLNEFTAGNYPGDPARAQGNHGHFVDVTLRACGDGVVQSGESCDAGALNGQPGSCCSTACSFMDGTTVCRAAVDTCDLPEMCDGFSGTCPADAKSTAVCRAADDDCDVAESCDGVNNACPSDVVLPNGQNCSAPCFSGAQCMDGVCIGGAPVVCPPIDGCPQACNVDSNSCEDDPNVESRPCQTCEDTVDNDADEDTDADDSDCSTLSEYQHFGLIGRATKGKSIILGSGVAVRSNQPGSHSASDPPFPSGQSRGGVCSNEAQMITTGQIAGAVAVGDDEKIKFGSGQDFNIGTVYAVGPLTRTILTGVAPVVGPGLCTGSMAACTLDAQCTFPSTCEGLLLNNPANTNVDTTGTHDEFVRCGDAMLAMVADAAYLSGLPVSNPAYDFGNIKLQVGDLQPIPNLTGPGPHILKASKVRVSPATNLIITADDPEAVVVILVEKSMTIGKTATVQVGGMLQARNVLWVMHGKGAVKLNGGSSFAGTVLGPERTIKLGQFIHVDGGLIGNKISIAGASFVTHLPFTPLL